MASELNGSFARTQEAVLEKMTPALRRALGESGAKMLAMIIADLSQEKWPDLDMTIDEIGQRLAKAGFNPANPQTWQELGIPEQDLRASYRPPKTRMGAPPPQSEDRGPWFSIPRRYIG